MKLLVNRKMLSAAVDHAAAAIKGRSPKPILQCLLLTASAEGVTIFATDLERWVKATVDGATVEQPGSAAIPAARLHDILRASTEETLSLKVADGAVTITGTNETYKLHTNDAKEFPKAGESIPAKFKLPVDTLHAMLDKTGFCSAKESTRYAFNGVLFEARHKTLKLVATDGRRLSQVSTPLATDAGALVSAIVPAVILPLVAKLEGEEVSVCISDTAVSFTTPSVSVGSVRLEGQFPPYDDVIPKEADKKVTLSRADFHGAVRRAALLSEEIDGGAKKLKLDLNKNGLVLSSRDANAGEATVKFPCKVEGQAMEIGFDGRFIADFLKVADTEEVTLELSQPNRPGLFKSGSDYLYVVMPTNLQ